MDVTAVASVPRSRFDHPPVPLPGEEGGDEANDGGQRCIPRQWACPRQRGLAPLHTPVSAVRRSVNGACQTVRAKVMAEGSIVTAARHSVCAVRGTRRTAAPSSWPSPPQGRRDAAAPLSGEGEGRRVSGRAPPVELAARHLAHWTGLEPGLSAAPGAIRLPLLPSGPDGVHGSPPRRAQLFASGPDQRYRDQASGRDSTPHEADFGCRAPLAPRLARPRTCYGPCARMVNTRGASEGRRGARRAPCLHATHRGRDESRPYPSSIAPSVPATVRSYFESLSTNGGPWAGATPRSA